MKKPLPPGGAFCSDQVVYRDFFWVAAGANIMRGSAGAARLAVGTNNMLDPAYLAVLKHDLDAARVIAFVG